MLSQLIVHIYYILLVYIVVEQFPFKNDISGQILKEIKVRENK